MVCVACAQYGGAIYIYDSSTATLSNCILSGNSASSVCTWVGVTTYL